MIGYGLITHTLLFFLAALFNPRYYSFFLLFLFEISILLRNTPILLKMESFENARKGEREDQPTKVTELEARQQQGC